MFCQLFELATISRLKKNNSFTETVWGSMVSMPYTLFYQQTLEIFQILVNLEKNVLNFGENMLNALFWYFLKNSQNVL